MLNITATIDASSVITNLRALPEIVQADGLEALKEGAQGLTQFLKYEVLSGQDVKTFSHELRNGVYYTISGKTQVTVRFRGPHAFIGAMLDAGFDRGGRGWNVNKAPNRVTFKIIEGPNGGRWVSTTKTIHHPGFANFNGRGFMRRAAERKKDRIVQLVERAVRKALRRSRLG
jgi:hypothetical protein